jgi:hypothetical protein
MPGGFIYGADIFHFVKYNPNDPDSVFSNSHSLNIDNCPIDFPISVLEITPAREYLLAFHSITSPFSWVALSNLFSRLDFGVFVGPNGQRTRTENVDWERIPLEFGNVDTLEL